METKIENVGGISEKGMFGVGLSFGIASIVFSLATLAGIASLVLGVIFAIFALIFGILGIVFGVVSYSKSSHKRGVSAFVCGIAGTTLTLILFILCLCMATAASRYIQKANESIGDYTPISSYEQKANESKDYAVLDNVGSAFVASLASVQYDVKANEFKDLSFDELDSEIQGYMNEFLNEDLEEIESKLSSSQCKGQRFYFTYNSEGYYVTIGNPPVKDSAGDLFISDKNYSYLYSDDYSNAQEEE